jgi:hypothetical protein
MVRPLLDKETPPWWSAMRRWADWLIIGVTLLVIVAGILLLILLPGQVGTFN